jgi:hypothetical protein
MAVIKYCKFSQEQDYFLKQHIGSDGVYPSKMVAEIISDYLIEQK